MEPDRKTPAGESLGLLPAFGVLLHDPVSAARAGSLRLWLGATLGIALYGLGAGSWQGGWTCLLAALKAPLIVIASLALCAPSLWVFLSLGGARLEPLGFARAVAGFVAVLAVVLAALLPVAWLFSVSTGSLGFLVLLHVALWMAALGLARGKLRSLLEAAGAPRPAHGWLLLVLLVSLQMATTLRPVLDRAPGSPLFDRGRLSFLVHFGRIVDGKR